MRGRWVPAAALVVLALAALVVVVLRRPPPPAGAPRSEPTATPVPTAIPRPTSGPQPAKEGRSTFVVGWAALAAATPTAPEEAPPRNAAPTPTPPPAECVSMSQSVGVLPGSAGRILVDVDLKNGCGRDLAPLDVWFEVDGYRQGDLVQSVRGHPFDAIERGGEGKAHIVLPGSIDWYDRIEVHPVPPGTP